MCGWVGSASSVRVVRGCLWGYGKARFARGRVRTAARGLHGVVLFGGVARGARRGGAGRGAGRGRRTAWRRRLGDAPESSASVRYARAKPELSEAAGRFARGGDQFARPVLAQRGVRQGHVGEKWEVPRHQVDVADAGVVANGRREARGGFDAVQLRGGVWEAGRAGDEPHGVANSVLARAHFIAGGCKWWRAARLCCVCV